MKAEVREGIILIDHEDIISTYGNLADADMDGENIIVTVDGQTSIIPLDGNWGDWSEVVTAWNELYPNGKPKPEPTTPEPSQEDYLLDLDYRLSKIELGV